MGMIPALENRFPEGYDLTIMNTYYNYPVFEDGKKLCDDFIVLVYKNNISHEKDYCIINQPDYTYYILKENEPAVDYNRMFIERDKVDPVRIKYSLLEKDIAEKTDNIDFYKYNILNKNRAENKKLHMDPNIFMSDMNICDHYRFCFAFTYQNNITKLDKGYFDIEVDGKWAAGDFVELGECAVNCVSFFDDKSDTAYTFILRDKRNPLIKIFEEEYISGKFTENDIKTFVINSVGGYKKAVKKFKLGNSKFKLLFYDYEIELIRDLFATIHSCSPDFIMGWNSSAFDLEYIIERIKALGYDPADIMCDQRWKYKIVKNIIDHRNINNHAERGDYTFISGTPIFIDQMIQYCSRRKSKIGSYDSFKLDDIGEREAGVHKLDYSYITNSVTELPWLNFKVFVLYNIMDVIVQKCIETKTQDMEYIFSKCVVNNTSYNKGHRQTTYLINRMASDWYKQGFIIGNNANKLNTKDAKFPGAFVGDPKNTNNYSKLKIDGRPIWVCDNLQDYDYKSLYPSTMGEYNIAPNTQIGKIIINDKVYNNENSAEEEYYCRSGEFIENMTCDNYIEFCHRWFNLANIEEFINDLNEYFNIQSEMFKNINYSELLDNPKYPLLPVTKNIINPIINNNLNNSPIIFLKERDKNKNFFNIVTSFGGNQ